METIVLKNNNELLDELRLNSAEALRILKKLSIITFSICKNGLIKFIQNFEDYSIQNIKEKGWTEILYKRAIRFFNLLEVKNNVSNKIKRNKRHRSYASGKNRGGEHVKIKAKFKMSLRTLFLPIYWLICGITLIQKLMLKKFTIPISKNKQKLNLYNPTSNRVD